MVYSLRRYLSYANRCSGVVPPIVRGLRFERELAGSFCRRLYLTQFCHDEFTFRWCYLIRSKLKNLRLSVNHCAAQPAYSRGRNSPVHLNCLWSCHKTMIWEIITQRMVKFLVHETFSHIFIRVELWYLHLSEMFGAYAFLLRYTLIRQNNQFFNEYQ